MSPEFRAGERCVDRAEDIDDAAAEIILQNLRRGRGVSPLSLEGLDKLFARIASTGETLSVSPHDWLNPGFGFQAKLEGPNGEVRTCGLNPAEALAALVASVS